MYVYILFKDKLATNPASSVDEPLTSTGYAVIVVSRIV